MKGTILILLVILLWSAPVAALEIVYPSDKSYFTRSNFLIIKGGESPALEGVVIEFGGASSDLIDISGEDYRSAFGDFIILQPEFDPGANLLKVQGYVDGKMVAEATADIYYLEDPSSLPPRGYRPFVMHLPQKEALCAPCHDMNPDRAELQIENAQQNPCASCHRRMLNQEHVHGPAGVYRCTFCHQPDSSPAKYQVRKSGADLCNECHLGKVEQFKTSKYVHGPVGAGLCTVCHDPHASEYPAQLLAPINDVCLGCHETIAEGYHVVRGVGGQGHPLKGVPDPSRPGEPLSCASCHDPHGGASAYFFTQGITGRFTLCQVCHAK